MNIKLILQSEASECGIACLAMVAGHFGQHWDLTELRRRFAVSLKGVTLAQVMRHASALGLAARPVRLDMEDLPELQLPCILHWNLNHFVVLKKVIRSGKKGTQLVLLDPAVGERVVSQEETSDQFTGVALELFPTEAFELKPKERRLPISAITGRVVGLRRALTQLLVMAFALEMFALVAPLFNQFVTDEVIVGADRELMTVLVLGFAFLLVTQTTISVGRSWFLMRWSIDVGLQWSTRVMSHMTRLPVSFFEKRHLGDIVSRFGSIGAIQNTLTRLFLESALDGLMAVLALLMMLMYSGRLTAIVLVAVVLYVALRALAYSPFREASRERLVLASKESSNFMETIRAMTPLKLFGREAERRARWLNLKQDVINRDIKTEKMNIMFGVSNTFIAGCLNLTMFYVGAGLVIDNAMTIGMLFAFSSYAATFSSRIFNLVDLFISLKMLSLHSERLSDILLEEPEPEAAVETDIDRLRPNLTLRNIRFRYADGEPWILNGVNLDIPAGQNLAVIGASGCGKTTLCKIILGLVQPTEGDILIDNIPIQQLGLRSYRKLVGTVMQDDVLLSGSLSDNISFFDTSLDQKAIEHAAQLAAIHEDISAMPMGYQTLVGELGSSLSGGQKQRVLLARALYKKPSILALDEATSHLDVNNEKRVNAALATLPLTKIVIAHRPETIAAAERVVELAGGVVRELRPAEPVYIADRSTELDTAELLS